MSSRADILQNVKNNQPDLLPLPPVYQTIYPGAGPGTFAQILQSIGGTVHNISSVTEVMEVVKNQFPDATQILSVLADVPSVIIPPVAGAAGQLLDTVEVAIIEAAFGVAENGAVWITEALSTYRVLPFIAEHLVVVLPASSIVPTMHHAYKIIQDQAYDFGVFIAGPSKTADIEQSLVLGAHGPKTMTVLLRS